MTSPAAAAVGVNAIGGLNAAAAAYSPYGTSPQQASPQAFFYNPLYQAQLSAAAAAAAANSSQGSLIPATSPACEHLFVNLIVITKNLTKEIIVALVKIVILNQWISQINHTDGNCDNILYAYFWIFSK